MVLLLQAYATSVLQYNSLVAGFVHIWKKRILIIDIVVSGPNVWKTSKEGRVIVVPFSLMADVLEAPFLL